MLYLPCSSWAEAEKIARALVEEKLVVCANIVPGIKSIYRWKGKIEQATEAVIFAKTLAAKKEALEKRIKELHSYETPAIVFLEVESMSKETREWLEKELK